MVTNAADLRDWLLVAPWYRAARQVRPHRDTRPVVLKYAESDPTTAFLTDPQHSLVWNADDYVYEVRSKTPPSRLPGFAALKRSLTERTPDSLQPSIVVDSSVHQTTTRKLYLDIHQRFYLVSMEARLDTPELSCVPAGRMCEYGFVVRRVTSTLDVVDPDIQNLAVVYREAQADVRLGVAGGLQSTASQLVTAQERLVAAESALAGALDAAGIDSGVEQWVDLGGGIGRWAAITDETPSVLDEATYPVFPLVPGEADPDHSGVGHALFFGLLPTTSAGTTPDGEARFESTSLYEVRTFARRHDPDCERQSTPADCEGDIFWSRPTERYQVADAFDPRGTGNRPANIKLPSLDELAAQVAALPPGRATSARIEAPTMLVPSVPDPPAMPEGGSESDEVCFFGIPLITIVALFVLQIFLGIVLFIFNLWWMLKLKLCIPPSLGLGAGFDAAIAIEAPSLSIDADLDIALEVGDITDRQYRNLQTAFKEVLLDSGYSDAVAGAMVDSQSLQSLRTLGAELEQDPRDERQPTLSYEEPVTRKDFEDWEQTFRELVA